MLRHRCFQQLGGGAYNSRFYRNDQIACGVVEDRLHHLLLLTQHTYHTHANTANSATPQSLQSATCHTRLHIRHHIRLGAPIRSAQTHQLVVPVLCVDTTA
eukprot:TRINITY_DN1314_c0_g1_i5.p1 TRINITY_DN1314_c0_g1~~TRINITY_DN1314_c0_g1_i5.p1  ORF type:complete len:101 (+),score=17.32 TRINITY_DN1314_c0_g1_i5:324-626(+)